MIIFNYLSSFTIFLLSVYIYRNRDNVHNLITAIMLFTLGLAPFSWILFRDSKIFTNELNIWILFFPFLLLFSIVYPYEIKLTKKIKNSKYKYIIFAPYFLYFIIYFLIKILTMVLLKETFLFDIIKGTTDLFLSKIFSLLLLILNIFYIFISTYILKKKMSTCESISLKKQLKLITFGIQSFAFVFIISIISQYFGLFSNLITSERIKYLYSFAIIINAILISLAMVKYKFLNIRLKRKSVLYYFVWVFFISIYALIITFIISRISQTYNNSYSYISIALSYVIFILYYRYLKKFISYFFIKDQMNYEEIIKNFFMKIAKYDSFSEIRNSVIEELKKLLNIENVDIILFDDINEKYSRKNYYDYFEVDEYYQKNYKWALYFFPLKFNEKIFGFLLIGSKISKNTYKKTEIDILKSITLQISMLLHNMSVNKQLYEKKVMEKELNLAKKIQFSLLPEKNIKNDNFDIYWRYKPATKIGGDYCDVIEVDNKLCFLIADVSGKGIKGAIYMSMIRTLFHTALRSISVKEILMYLNKYLKEKLPAKLFVTMLVFLYDYEKDEIEYIHLGHNNPIYFDSKKDNVKYLESDGMALGMVDNSIFDEVVSTKNIKMEEDDFIFLYTDGITEARNQKEEFFGSDRLFEIVSKYRDSDVKTITNKVSQNIFRFRGEYKQSDDIAMLSFRKKSKGN